TRDQLALFAVMRTAFYDSAVFPCLSTHLEGAQASKLFPPVPEIIERMSTYMNLFSTAMKSLHGDELAQAEDEKFAEREQLSLNKISDLRYGENPHQAAALYEVGAQGGISTGVAAAEQLGGKEMSFNNYVDADAAWQLVCDFEKTACAIIKHTNPAGAAIGANAENAYRRALACDPISAFGGIVAFNRRVDVAAAQAVVEIF